MTARNRDLGCARANELVAFLYDEVNNDEARDFELHLRNCAECSAEFVGFKKIRQSIGAWRHECLDVFSSGLGRSNTVEVSDVFRRVPQDNRSAIAAVRQFLAFSPVWLKGAVAFASLAFCVVAALAIYHLLEKPELTMVASERVYTERELKAKIEEQMQSLALQERKDEEVRRPDVNRTDQQQATMRRNTRRTSERALNTRVVTRRPLTKSEREQLAADLRLISPSEEDGPDLLYDRLSN